jgi:hypothetical protein
LRRSRSRHDPDLLGELGRIHCARGVHLDQLTRERKGCVEARFEALSQLSGSLVVQVARVPRPVRVPLEQDIQRRRAVNLDEPVRR